VVVAGEAEAAVAEESVEGAVENFGGLGALVDDVD
jgi:hypothetical protein